MEGNYFKEEVGAYFCLTHNDKEKFPVFKQHKISGPTMKFHNFFMTLAIYFFLKSMISRPGKYVFKIHDLDDFS